MQQLQSHKSISKTPLSYIISNDCTSKLFRRNVLSGNFSWKTRLIEHIWALLALLDTAGFNLQEIVKVNREIVPGSNFLGKRRYFSGIVALTPLTPLTYKQNAVNAFIPTKNAVNAAIFPVKRR